ncbi:hypothetical protein E1265_07140 [Streptomyces sp. 8K308]|uniref:hypothetical protein n=1 Tax=Streptomyces sp. 8K308 TaxID=2530388 RepID=UPI00104B3D75|nr:hypothetical protein [Streptomyces sp. 8K308]TDC25423.1 hypothetical protein E1265_07140 [Streptomyces sp. 8K308]
MAEKLQWLRETKTPKGEQPPSYDMTARQITELTGISISGPYFWELVTGRTTNPKLHHLQALAQFFNVPVAYLAEPAAEVSSLESEMELLHALKSGEASGIGSQRSAGAAEECAALQSLLGKLQLLQSLGDEEVLELAVRLRGLDSGERRVLDEAAGDAALLGALRSDRVRGVALGVSQLSEDSQQAILGLVEHLHRVENPGRG